MEKRHISSRYKINARSVKVPARHIDGVYERPLKISTKKTKVVVKEKPSKVSSDASQTNIEATTTASNHALYQTTSPSGEPQIVHRVIHEYYQANNQPVPQQVLYPQYPVTMQRVAAQVQNQKPVQQQPRQQVYTQPIAQPRMAYASSYGAPATRPVTSMKPKKDTVFSRISKKLKDNSTKRVKQDNGKLKPSDVIRYAVVTVFVVLAGYLAYDTWQTNQQLQNAVKGDSASAQSYESSADVSNPPVSNGEAYPEYKVAADHPRIIMIPSVNITARMTNVGLTSNSKIEVPSDSSYAGWYTGASVPGSYGAAFVTGHYNGVNAGGVFDNLSSVVAGDEISVEMGDGTIYKYEVVSSELVPVGQVDMAKALSVIDGEDEGLNIMTCAGAFTSGGFADRLTVYTKRV